MTDEAIYEAPPWFTDDQRAAFTAIRDQLAEEQRLSEGDVPVLHAAAMSLGIAIAANRDVQTRGLLVEKQIGGYNGAALRTELVKNPALQIMHEALSDFYRAASQLGIGPAARAKLAKLGVTGNDGDTAIPGLAEMAALQDG
jgi:P27 family predicted phage terminase small subunit